MAGNVPTWQQIRADFSGPNRLAAVAASNIATATDTFGKIRNSILAEQANEALDKYRTRSLDLNEKQHEAQLALGRDQLNEKIRQFDESQAWEREKLDRTLANNLKVAGMKGSRSGSGSGSGGDIGLPVGANGVIDFFGDSAKPDTKTPTAKQTNTPATSSSPTNSSVSDADIDKAAEGLDSLLANLSNRTGKLSAVPSVIDRWNEMNSPEMDSILHNAREQSNKDIARADKMPIEQLGAFGLLPNIFGKGNKVYRNAGQIGADRFANTLAELTPSEAPAPTVGISPEAARSTNTGLSYLDIPTEVPSEPVQEPAFNPLGDNTGRYTPDMGLGDLDITPEQAIAPNGTPAVSAEGTPIQIGKESLSRYGKNLVNSTLTDVMTATRRSYGKNGKPDTGLQATAISKLLSRYSALSGDELKEAKKAFDYQAQQTNNMEVLNISRAMSNYCGLLLGENGSSPTERRRAELEAVVRITGDEKSTKALTEFNKDIRERESIRNENANKASSNLMNLPAWIRDKKNISGDFDEGTNWDKNLVWDSDRERTANSAQKWADMFRDRTPAEQRAFTSAMKELLTSHGGRIYNWWRTDTDPSDTGVENFTIPSREQVESIENGFGTKNWFYKELWNLYRNKLLSESRVEEDRARK